MSTELITSGHGPALSLLVEAAGSLLAAPPGSSPGRPVPAPAAARLEEDLRRSLEDPALLPREIAASSPPGGFGKYLLHEAPGFVLFSTVTAPGVAAPIHDHGSWGVLGLFRGAEEEVRYVVEPASSPGAPGRLVEVGRTSHVAGDVIVIGPPPDDVHQVFNRGTTPSVVLHLFLGDLVRSGFRVFEPPDYRPRHTGPLEYDQMPATFSPDGP